MDMSMKLGHSGSISAPALEALQADADLPICTACGTQYPSRRDNCPICEDPRQAVNPSGQSWTTLSELSSSRSISLVPDAQDDRIFSIRTEPAFGINQTPFLIQTSGGSYIWDCAACITPALVSYLSTLARPLRAIAISHPHFFATSLTWSRALRVPLYLCEADKEWFQRAGDITDKDDVRWWSSEAELGDRVQVVQCGGHFAGSSILYWDRLTEPPPSPSHLPTKPTPVSGIIFTADTVMVQPTQTKFTFIWSAPNMIPLNPASVVDIHRTLKPLSFSQATSTWPNRFIREDAKEVLTKSVEDHLLACGWAWDGDKGLQALEVAGMRQGG